MLKTKEVIEINSKVMLDTYNKIPFQEMEVINKTNNYDSIVCRWQDGEEYKEKSFAPQELSLLIDLDTDIYPHLILLKKLF